MRWPDPDSAHFASFSAVLAVVLCFSESHQTLQLITELSGFSGLEIWATLECASRHSQGLSGMGQRPWEFSHISTCFPFFFNSPLPSRQYQCPRAQPGGPCSSFPCLLTSLVDPHGFNQHLYPDEPQIPISRPALSPSLVTYFSMSTKYIDSTFYCHLKQTGQNQILLSLPQSHLCCLPPPNQRKCQCPDPQVCLPPVSSSHSLRPLPASFLQLSPFYPCYALLPQTHTLPQPKDYPRY